MPQSMSANTLRVSTEVVADADEQPSAPATNRETRRAGAKLTDEQKRIRASLAAHTSWANTADKRARTANARAGRWSRYVERAREIHEGAEVTEDFILDVAEHLRQADMKRMALASSKARSAKKAARKAGK